MPRTLNKGTSAHAHRCHPKAMASSTNAASEAHRAAPRLDALDCATCQCVVRMNMAAPAACAPWTTTLVANTNT